MMQFLSDRDIVVFDLDDTLYKEEDYLKSAYRKIAYEIGLDVSDEMYEWYKSGHNAFQLLIDKYDLSVSTSDLLDIYRYHKPDISLLPDAKNFLNRLMSSNVSIGIISDGRSKTQRNKLNSLGLDWIKDVIISEEFGSEKPSEANYRYFMDKYPGFRFSYLADNIKKDFVTPNRLGWNTICLKDDGRNIHKQDLTVAQNYMPMVTISSFDEL